MPYRAQLLIMEISIEGWRQCVVDMVPAELVRFDEPMSRHTSFKIGGPADVFLAPRSYDDLLTCLEVVKKNGLPCFLLGGGTNILVADRGIRGVVISTAGLDSISVTGERLTAEAGARVEDVCMVAAEYGLSGVEFINGMPGSIGGAVWMNARCYGNSISEVLEQVEVVGEDLSLTTVSCDPSQFDYKRSPFQAMSGCIWQVKLHLKKGDRQEIYRKMEENHKDRVDKGHFKAPSAGSLFKNNHDFGAPTGKIIDELGLRGVTSGGAAIAPFHGNIFINQNNATAGDVLSLIRLAVEKAARERGIRLEPEVRLVGDWSPEELSFLTNVA
ncbi:UDP-N-acetylmuramate dehydrogenase [Desulfopila aestuarii DSM 18488]|uniref:UDP-N-acetylenolpyruvoylglucosamine reductase n=2 Tax=Desulfopila aestuarii TaxID=231440 RepID=A0A1M7YBE2_9BACT|nr:UDP-N-acetylmuramate dehydrogenase [Desulfopila aestuarii DSM 18488]